MTRDDLKAFRALNIDFDAIGLMEDSDPARYFCDPVDLEPVGRIGCDGVHFILLPGDERVYCVDPAMGEEGKYVLPVGSDFREFLSFLLYCKDASPLSQIWWLTEERFRDLLAEDAAASWPGSEEYFEKTDAALAKIMEIFGIVPVDPYEKVRALQAAFDASGLKFSDEYYDTLGIEREWEGRIFMLPQDPMILLSYVNTKLRDEYGSLEDLCGALDISSEELSEKLSGLDCAYDEDSNQFRLK